jgi:hypothetical protein
LKPGIHPSTQTSHKKFHCWTFKGKEGKCTLWQLMGLGFGMYRSHLGCMNIC